MTIVYVLVPLALLLGLGFAALFVFSARSGQFDDLKTPAERMLIPDEILEGEVSENEVRQTSSTRRWT